MAFILQSIQDPTLYFVGTILKKTETPVFDTIITQARRFGTRSEASQVKDLVLRPTQIIEVV
jgi:hypothetical protein